MNLFSFDKNSTKIILALAAILFILMGTFGLFLHAKSMNSDGTMSGCLFNGSSEICMMKLEHITLWKQMFASLLQEVGSLSLLLLLVLSFITFYEKDLFNLFEFKYRNFYKQKPEKNLFNFLKEVFSNGILNPKVYELA